MPPGPTGRPEPRRNNLDPNWNNIPHLDPLRLVIQGQIVTDPATGQQMVNLKFIDGPCEAPAAVYTLIGLALMRLANVEHQKTIEAMAKEGPGIIVPTDQQLKQATTLEGLVKDVPLG
jgi:hypothetical protein